MVSDELDPVLQAALQDLTRQVFEKQPREGEALGDPTSRAGAVHLFKHLKYHEYHWNVESVKEWAESHHWPARDARTLGDYAKGVQDGRRYHTQPDPWGRQPSTTGARARSRPEPEADRRAGTPLRRMAASVARARTRTPPIQLISTVVPESAFCARRGLGERQPWRPIS